MPLFPIIPNEAERKLLAQLQFDFFLCCDVYINMLSSSSSSRDLSGPNKTVSQRLIYLNTCSPIGGIVCGVEGNLGDGVLLEVVTRG